MESAATRSSRRKPLARRTLDLLVAEGFRPRMLRNDPPYAVLTFDHQGEGFRLQLHDQEPGFLLLDLRCLMPQPRPSEEAALRAARDVQNTFKLVKVSVGRERALVELQAPFVVAGARLRPEVLRRCMRLVRRAAIAFHAAVLLETTQVLHA